MLSAIQPNLQPRTAQRQPMAQKQGIAASAVQPSFKENTVAKFSLGVIAVGSFIRLCAWLWMLYSDHRWPFG